MSDHQHVHTAGGCDICSLIDQMCQQGLQLNSEEERNRVHHWLEELFKNEPDAELELETVQKIADGESGNE